MITLKIKYFKGAYRELLEELEEYRRDEIEYTKNELKLRKLVIDIMKQ